MEETRQRRPRRTPEEKAADIDAKIQQLKDSIVSIEEKKAAAIADFDSKSESVKAKIAALEEQKKAVLAPPKPRKPRPTVAQRWEDAMKTAKKAGIKPEELVAMAEEKLGQGNSEE